MYSISLECIHIIEKSLVQTNFIGGVSAEDPYAVAKHYLNPDRLEEQIEMMERFEEIKGSFLEVGSGFGGLVTYLNKKYHHKVRAYGIDPSADAYDGTMQCAKLLAASNNIADRFVSAVGEALPFPDETFDWVYSTSVLEHVKDSEKVLSESIRVLKKGGILQFVIPNYGSFWEGHYGILILPYMPKWLFKFFVLFLGRDPKFVDTLNLTTRRSIQSDLKPVFANIQIISWGVDVWENRLRSLEFSEWASLGRLKQYVKIAHKLGVVEWIIRLNRYVHWETPFVLTLRKKS